MFTFESIAMVSSEDLCRRHSRNKHLASSTVGTALATVSPDHHLYSSVLYTFAIHNLLIIDVRVLSEPFASYVDLDVFMLHEAFEKKKKEKKETAGMEKRALMQ